MAAQLERHDQPSMLQNFIDIHLKIDDGEKKTIYDMISANTSETEEITSEYTEIPTHTMSDYIEMGIYTVMFVVGGLINLYVMRKLQLLYRRRTKQLHQWDIKTAFILMKMHLTVSNLLVCMIMCPWRFAWLYTYSWNWGDAMCKVANYLFMVAVDMPSYITTCIAIDRARVVFALTKAQSGNVAKLQHNCMFWVRVLATSAWCVAAIPSCMQLLLWSTIEPDPVDNAGWYQCTTIWFIKRYMGETDDANFPYVRYYGLTMFEYQLWHLVMTFWAPFIIILACYGYITIVLCTYSCRPYSAIPKGAPAIEERTLAPLTISNHNAELNELPSTELSANDVKCDIEIQLASNGATKVLASPRPNNHGMNETVFNNPPVSSTARNRQTTLNSTPSWRLQLRSKMFNTSGLVVLCFLVFWLPYSTMNLIAMFDMKVAAFQDDYLYMLQSLIHLNTVVSPFLYGFTDD